MEKQPSESLIELLDLTNPAAHTTRLLTIASWRGILDTAHADRLGLSSNARDEQIKRLVQNNLLSLLPQPEKLRTGRGAPRGAYALTQTGAHLCNSLGLSSRPGDCHAYGQTTPPDQRHDLYLVDLALAAQDAGLPVRLETPIYYDGGSVRSDVLILPDQQPPIAFEVEGLTDWHQRARLIDKVLRWSALVDSSLNRPAPPIDPNIRVLWIAERDDHLVSAGRIWAEVIAIARATYERPLPAQFWGQSIGSFAAQPGWRSLDGFQRLDDPALSPDFGPPVAQPAEAEIDQPQDAIAALIPPEALADPALDEQARLRLRAHARVLGRYLRTAPRRFSPVFFEMARDLYALAFPEQDNDGLLSIPWPALLTLRTWIHHDPDLAQALQLAYREFRQARNSGIQMTMQKATELIDVFLRYHGLRFDSPLMHIWVARPGEVHRRSRLTVQVDIETHPDALQRYLPPGNRLPDAARSLSGPDSPDNPDQIDPKLLQLTEQALQWILQQLIDQADILEIKPAARQPVSPSARQSGSRETENKPPAR